MKPMIETCETVTADELVKRQAAEIERLRTLLKRIEAEAKKLRNEIGNGSALDELHARVHNLVEMCRKK
jgi:hypothetical protein